MLDSVKFQVSNNHVVQSFPTVTKLFPSEQKEISKTSMSLVMTNFDSCYVSMSQIEHVVSIEQQHIILGSRGFQSKLVNGADKSFYY